MKKVWIALAALVIMPPVQYADACSFVSSAHCYWKAPAAGINSGQEVANQCYNQQTQQGRCVSDVQSMWDNNGNIVSQVKNAAIAAGGCGPTQVQVLAAVGSRSYEVARSVTLSLPGVFVPAVPAHCPVGYSAISPLLGGVPNLCYKQVPSVAVCPSGQWIDHGFCTKTIMSYDEMKTRSGNATKIKNVDPLNAGYFTFDGNLYYRGSPPNLTCPNGYSLVGIVCRQSVPIIPLVAAHCQK